MTGLAPVVPIAGVFIHEVVQKECHGLDGDDDKVHNSIQISLNRRTSIVAIVSWFVNFSCIMLIVLCFMKPNECTLGKFLLGHFE